MLASDAYEESPCFLEGTRILSLVEGDDTYVPIETLRTGDLIKTLLDGYKKVAFIGKGEIYNPNNNERIENRLYKYTPKNYPDLTKNLYLTGCHSILVNNLSEIKKDKIIKNVGNLFITDNKYRMIAYLDEHAKPWNKEGYYTIWHLALENMDTKMNYGIYVNGGLLVETCSINYLKKSDLFIV